MVSIIIIIYGFPWSEKAKNIWMILNTHNNETSENQGRIREESGRNQVLQKFLLRVQVYRLFRSPTFTWKASPT